MKRFRRKRFADLVPGPNPFYSEEIKDPPSKIRIEKTQTGSAIYVPGNSVEMREWMSLLKPIIEHYYSGQSYSCAAESKSHRQSDQGFKLDDISRHVLTEEEAKAAKCVQMTQHWLVGTGVPITAGMEGLLVPKGNGEASIMTSTRFTKSKAVEPGAGWSESGIIATTHGCGEILKEETRNDTWS